MRNQSAGILNFAQKPWLQLTFKTCENRRKKTWSNYEKILKIIAFFSCFAFISQQFAQFLKYFALTCDCIIAAFISSGDTWHLTHDTWHMTHDTWRMTHYMWHMTCDTWHVTNSEMWIFPQSFRSLALTIWNWRCFEYILGKGWLTTYINQSETKVF